MALPIFPAHIFRHGSVKADPRPSLISGGVSLSGIEDVIETDRGGPWQITMSGINLRTPQTLRLWDMWTSFMPGRVFLVPLLSVGTSPRPSAGGGLARPSALQANDPNFPTQVRYAAPYIVAQTDGNAALGATEVTINVIQGARIQGGERMSIGERAFKIERVLSGSAQQATVRVHPPARAAIGAGAAVNFEWPVVRCRLVVGQDLAPDVSFGRRAEVSISFVEDFSDAV